MTHRNPAQVIASDASFRYYLNSTVGDVSKLPAKETYGPRLLDFWMRGLERALEARKRIGEDRFVDVRNADVISQPIATFERTYAALGMDFTDETRTAIEAYLDHNRQGAHGSHDYTAEEYGLTDAMVRERFAEYCERFGV